MAEPASKLDSYIVRVYRRDVDGGIAGIVELPVQSRRIAFQGFEQLRAILTQTSGTDAPIAPDRNQP